MITFVDDPDAGHTFSGTVEGRAGSSSGLSLAALRLHAQALLASFERGRVGYVPDDYLAGIGREVGLTVVELCLRGIWTRAEDGYRVTASEAVRMAAEVHRQLRQAQRR